MTLKLGSLGTVSSALLASDTEMISKITYQPCRFLWRPLQIHSQVSQPDVRLHLNPLASLIVKEVPRFSVFLHGGGALTASVLEPAINHPIFFGLAPQVESVETAAIQVE